MERVKTFARDHRQAPVRRGVPDTGEVGRAWLDSSRRTSPAAPAAALLAAVRSHGGDRVQDVAAQATLRALRPYAHPLPPVLEMGPPRFPEQPWLPSAADRTSSLEETILTDAVERQPDPSTGDEALTEGSPVDTVTEGSPVDTVSTSRSTSPRLTPRALTLEGAAPLEGHSAVREGNLVVNTGQDDGVTREAAPPVPSPPTPRPDLPRPRNPAGRRNATVREAESGADPDATSALEERRASERRQEMTLVERARQATDAATRRDETRRPPGGRAPGPRGAPTPRGGTGRAEGLSPQAAADAAAEVGPAADPARAASQPAVGGEPALRRGEETASDAAAAIGGDASLDALATSDVALIDEELAEHQRWGAALEQVGEAGSVTRANFLAQQADAGALGGGSQALVTGLGMGAATRALEIAGERGAVRLAGQALGRTAPIPAIGAVIGGVMSAMDLAERDWGQTGQTIGRFGEGTSDYDRLANSIAAVSEIISVYTSVLNVIAGVVGAISIAMWIITVVTVGVASPLAVTLSTIAAAIGIATMILDAINALVLQPLITTFRALHAFKSQADPTEVEEQGTQVRQAAAAGAGFVGGFAGGLAGSHGASAVGRRAGLTPPHVTAMPHESPPPRTGEGTTIHADPPQHAPSVGEGMASRQPGEPILPPAESQPHAAPEGGPQTSRGPLPDEFRMVDDEPAGGLDQRRASSEELTRAGELEPTPEQLAEMGLTPDQYEIAMDMRRVGVEPELNATPGPHRRFLQPGERMPGRIETPSRVKSDARRRARAEFEETMTAALHDESLLTPEIHEAIDRMRPDQRAEMADTGRLPEHELLADLDAQAEAEGQPPGTSVGMPGPRGPGSFDVRHIETVADSPHTAHIGERTTAAPHAEHMMIDHAMDGTFPLEASTPRDPNALATWGWQLDPRAQPPAARATETNPTGRLPRERDFGLRPGTDANIVAETRERAARAIDPGERARLLKAADELERLSTAERARSSQARVEAGEELQMADPANGGRGAARPPRRSTKLLSDPERAQLLRIAAEMGYPPERVVFHDGPTSVTVRDGVLRIGPDVNPLPPEQRPTGLVNPANTAVEARGVLGHEIIGHIQAAEMGQQRPLRWHEEFQASTRAALLTPDLPRDQMHLLTQDAAARRRDQPQPGETIYVWTEPLRPASGHDAGMQTARPADHFRPQDQLPSVMIDWQALGMAPPAALSGARPPVRGAPRQPAGGSRQFSEPSVSARPVGALDRLRHGYVGTLAGGLWSAVPGVEQVHRGIRLTSTWFGDERLRPPPSRRDAMGQPIDYSANERRAIAIGGQIGSHLFPLGGAISQRVAEGVTRRGLDVREGLFRGATEPIVERVNPLYPPPPEGGYAEINALQERMAGLLESRALAEATAAHARHDAAHHQANIPLLNQFEEQTSRSISATQAHQAATQRREQANARRQASEADVSRSLADAAQRRSGLSTLTVPLRGFQRFSSLGESLPDGTSLYPTALVGPKAKIRQLNRDSTDFLNALDGVDATIREQRDAAGPRQQDVSQNSNRLSTTGTLASVSLSSLQGTRQQGHALARRNQQRADASTNVAQVAAAQRIQLDGEAQQTQVTMQATAQRWQAWATAHRAARQAAIERRRRSLEERGYRVRQVSGPQ
jgi:hypothetical protein